MKTPTVLKTCGFLAAASLLGFPPARAEESPVPETSILGEIADGSAVPAPVPAPAPDFTVESEIVFPMKVDEPPEIPGVPGVKGIVDAVVQLVADPALPDLPFPDGEAMVEPELPENPAPSGQAGVDAGLLHVTATVFNHSLTLLTCNTGEPGVTDFAAWSNLDFNHFGGFTAYQVKGTDGQVRIYNLILALVNADAPPSAGILGETGIPLDSLPVPGGVPAFVALDDGNSNPAGLAAIRDMHELYKTEGTRMATAYEARRTAEAARRAELLADPPVPQGATLRFWPRTPGGEVPTNGGGQ